MRRAHSRRVRWRGRHLGVMHRGPGVLVANLSTSRMIDRIAEGFSEAKVVLVLQLAANVVDVMEQSNAILVVKQRRRD